MGGAAHRPAAAPGDGGEGPGLTAATAIPRVPLWKAIHAQRAVRRMSDRPVDVRLLELCVEAAVQAPSGSNAQRWEWILIRDPDVRRRLAELNRA